ncbi:TetR/AcrR family transcriptional regulator [Arenibacter sp. GZD96]|uniref:TetR/AcrR family transcriptional regulator n=1 Tax=Aurantibrevibacter litoralis TaxID=3106030 RepID=UPI002AFE0834|nr:TetR/AcrR family transcriptional regulator [Arenibacter sp. GZD-96]MEA1787190.1 TetR/AcrR family transcriptional regulator [Arenibacter sp. GZD-96]
MEQLMQSVKIGINEKIYLKDPESSELGRRILLNGISMIHEVGFEAFTFKKLGEQIGSNESSIYRYFESKHKFLLYLVSWYWGWMEYQLVFATNSIPDPEEKLRMAISIVTKLKEQNATGGSINHTKLTKIMINEFSKSYLTKEVDAENEEGYFVIYKRLVNRLAKMIEAVDADYPYPLSLSSNVVEGGLHQHFLMDHFPSLTNCKKSFTPTSFYTDLVFRTLNRN